MPQLVRGGKWVFGWVIVGRQGELAIPPEAWDEYGFQPGEEAAFLPGSQTSGGFGLSTPRLLEQAAGPLQTRCLARGQIGEDGQIVVPPEAGVQSSDWLLAVRGSCRALGFVTRGPIFGEALKHPEINMPVTVRDSARVEEADLHFSQVCLLRNARVSCTAVAYSYLNRHSPSRKRTTPNPNRTRMLGRISATPAPSSIRLRYPS